jgi:TPR repeat protein
MYKIIYSLTFSGMFFSAFIYADFDTGLTTLKNHDFIATLTEWKPLADKDKPKAHYALGFMFASTQKLPQNDVQAIILYRKDADQGDAQIQLNLGLIYATGQGVPKNDVQAIIWCSKAVDRDMQPLNSN